MSMPASSFVEVDSGEMMSTRDTKVFHLGQVETSSAASSTADAGAEMVVVAKAVQRPFVGYAGVPIGSTTSDFVKGDFGDFLGAAMLLFIS